MSVDTEDKCAESTRPFAAESLPADHPDHNDASSDSAEDVLELVSNTLDIGDKPSPELIKRYQSYMGYNVDRMCDAVLDPQNTIGMKTFAAGAGLSLMGQKMEEISTSHELLHVRQ